MLNISNKAANIVNKSKSKNCIFLFIPKIFYRLKIKSIMSQQYDQKDIDLRVNYYIKIKNKFKVSSKSMTITELWNHQIFKFNNNLIKNKKIKTLRSYRYKTFNGYELR